MIRAFGDFFKYYAYWSGRTGRKGYWYFIIGNFLVCTLLHYIDWMMAITLLGVSIAQANIFTGFYPLTFIYILITIIPGLALSIRRLHDIDKSGWWVLLAALPVVGTLCLFVMACLPGRNSNRFGCRPLTGYTL